MVPDSDEEAIGLLLDVDQTQLARRPPRRMQRALLGAALVLGVLAATLWATSKGQDTSLPVVPSGRVFEEKAADKKQIDVDVEKMQQGCCAFGGACGDCGDDGNGWCHLSASNCVACTGTFDSTGPAPGCGGSQPATATTGSGVTATGSQPATASLEPEEAFKRNDQRKRMVIEQDMQVLLARHAPRRQARFAERTVGRNDDHCHEQASHLFDEVASESGMGKELEDHEHTAFKSRFASAMQHRCKDIISERLFLKAAGEELEQQKPLVTAAMVDELNGAGLGFRAKMHGWLVHESVATLPDRLGLLPTPDNQKSVLKRPPPPRQAAAQQLPTAFRAELKWPQCKETILRVHNQGHCGGCWAFGGLASVDARMCIATNGSWNAQGDTLSRLHAVSCSTEYFHPGHDGCQGGWMHWPMEMMARVGVASSSCIPFYIGGDGAEHFDHKEVAPPCETHCQGGYSLPLSSDRYSSAGIASYDWIVQVHGDKEKIAQMKRAMYQEGPVAFAFPVNRFFMSYHSGIFSVCQGSSRERGNHAVYAFGWGSVAHLFGLYSVEYIEATNSWGPDWGENGHFKIHPRCITDLTIPGPIESSVVDHPVGKVDSDVPKDAEHEYWPWAEPDECPYTAGCITDLEGSGDYSNNEFCVSKKLNGMRISVAEFDLEQNFDTLKVNGKVFSGKQANGLEGLVVDEHGITFKTDKSGPRAGFKLCGSSEAEV